MANFVLSAHMTNGDVLPLLRLGAALRKRGHQATLVTHGAFGPLAEKAGIGFRELDPPEAYTGIMKDLQLLEDPLRKPELYAEYERRYYAPEKLQHEYDVLDSLCAQPDTVLIGRERSAFVAMMVAEKRRLPFVSVFLAPSYVVQLATWSELGHDFSMSIVNRFRALHGLSPVRDWLSWAQAAGKHIGFWPELFAPREPGWPLAVEAVGFPAADEAELAPLPERLLEFISSDAPPLLITGGTGKLLKPRFYEVCVEACRLLDRRAILVTRHEELVPRELPGTIQYHRVLPLAGVYPLLGGIIHHGGIGTVSASMAAGLPQLALAADTDRPDNAQRIKRLGLGDYLPPALWKPQHIAEALERIGTPQVKARCLHMQAALRQAEAMDVACTAVEAAVGQAAYAISSQAIADDYDAACRQQQPDGQTGRTGSTAPSLDARRRTMLVQQLLQARRAQEEVVGS
ncbi:glycosyltransferase [Paenibacillus athensensis]|uniref:Uncharacterized protein n=1 Tax=Paenibacillus athensensis TaxID=1967502 RepID=A0A4Y8Q9Y2_9BACL|nr:nucleotide disphospho-sugar-binding domain-containing protein [Paenibacillus athensensis]MCD1258912.1 glycosyltransferase [Paenibacillus athensensis]